MRIVEIRELAVPLQGDVANAVVDFSEHAVSLVAVVSDVQRNGRPVTGIAFNSIGRFAQGAIIRDRMAPRVVQAAPESLLDTSGAHPGDRIDPAKVLERALTNEKPGGHGDRAGAAGAIELACWDLNAKLADEPAYRTVATYFDRSIPATPSSPVYAAGGYYRSHERISDLEAEVGEYLDQGYRSVKIKIGGSPLGEDLARVEAAVAVAGTGSAVAVDANGRFEHKTALQYAQHLAPYGLCWYEEPGDPLDFAMTHDIIAQYDGRIATGENLFSVPDVKNLIRYAGLRPGFDVVQMDAGLSYGLTEYARMLQLLEAHGYDRSCAFPHGGHLLNLHIVVGLGLGGCEAYPGVFQPFGGYSPGCVVSDGHIHPTDDPGFGLEAKPELVRHIAELTS